MGSPLCKFAVIKKGLLARNEITLYSYFEHIILLKSSISCDARFEKYF